MLCEKCHYAVSNDVEASIGRYPLDKVHHATSASFHDSVQEGCYICVNTLEELTRAHGMNVEFPSDLDENLSGKNLKIGAAWTGQDVFTSYCLDRGEGQWDMVPEAYYTSFTVNWSFVKSYAPNSSRNNIVVAFALEPAAATNNLEYTATEDNNSEQCWNVIQKWRDNCQSNHQACKTSSDATFRPTRLVDFSHYQSRKQVQIVHTQSGVASISYMSLSHRWGSNKTIQLKKSNLSKFKKGISVNDLPQKYCDAIDVASRLGVNHIWIDSLCIIQDDKADWQREAGLMHQIYRHSLCNIAVTGAPDGEYGCFSKRNAMTASSCLVDMRPTAHTTTWSIRMMENLTERLSRQPLNQRAWVVQERVLSPRTIHFGSDQLYWECRELRACESAQMGHPSRDYFQALKNVVSPRSSSEPSVTDVLFSWDRTVGLYTSCGLTKPQDKLVALSGLAKVVQPKIGKYCAGLWEKTLIANLLWHAADGERTRGPRPVRYSDYVAPSWSWASVQGGVRIISDTNESLSEKKIHTMIEVLDVDVASKTPDTTGSIKNGTLKLECSLYMGLYTDDAWWAKQPPLQEGQKYDWIDLGDPKSGPAGLDFSVFPDGETDIGKMLFCMPVISSNRANKKRATSQGLILKPANRNPFSKTFRRVGYYEELADDYESRFWAYGSPETIKLI